MSLKKFLSKDIYLQLLLIVPAVALAGATGWEGFSQWGADRLD